MNDAAHLVEAENSFAEMRSSLSPKGDRLTQDLAAFVAETPSTTWPRAIVENAKTAILDTFGVSLAAAPRSIGQIILRYATEAGPSPAAATIIGSNIRVSCEMAALANGTLANALDFNEGTHVSTHVLPALLSLGERDNRSGKDILDAFIIGFEAGARFSEAFDSARNGQQGPTYRGWWHVGLTGPIAAAMAASRLLRLDRHHTATAISIASCSCGGFRRNMGSMAKPLHSGNAARAGIQGALLARAGFTADPDVLEAPLGFMEAVCLPGESDPAAISERLGNPYLLAEAPRVKPYPSCARAHPGLDAIHRLLQREQFTYSDVELIEADLEPFSLLRPIPADEDEAGFSGAYLFAAAIVHRRLGIEEVSEAALHDPRVTALMRRIKFVPGKKLVIRLRDGRRLTEPTAIPGIPKYTLLTSQEDVRNKFLHCVEPVLGPERADRLLSLLRRFEQLESVDELMAMAEQFRRPDQRSR